MWGTRTLAGLVWRHRLAHVKSAILSASLLAGLLAAIVLPMGHRVRRVDGVDPPVDLAPPLTRVSVARPWART